MKEISYLRCLQQNTWTPETFPKVNSFPQISESQVDFITVYSDTKY